MKKYTLLLFAVLVASYIFIPTESRECFDESGRIAADFEARRSSFANEAYF